jgi:hypothetical protein
MPAEVDIVITRFETDAAQAIAATQQYAGANRAAEQAARGAAAAHVEAGRARDRAAGSTRTFGQAVMQWARDDAREARAANRVVSEFLRFVPATSLAGQGLRSIGAMMIGGGILGAGLQAASFGIGLLTDKLQENERAQKAAAEAAASHASSLVTLNAAADASARTFYRNFTDFKRTDEEKFVEGATAAIKAKVDQLEVEHAAKQAQLDALRATADKEEIKKRQDELDALQASIYAMQLRLQDERMVAQAAFPLLDAEKKAHDAKKQQDEKDKADREKATQDLAAQREAERRAAFAYLKAQADAVREGEKLKVDAQIAAEEKADQARQEAQKQAVATLAQHEEELARERLYAGEGAAARELAAVDAKYARLLDAARTAGQDELAIEEEKQAALQVVRDRYREESVRKALAAVWAEARAVVQIFVPGLIAGWQRAAAANRRYTAEYGALSMERREQQLLESGVAQTSAEAHAIAAEEADAAAKQQAAAEKQAIAERLAALAVEWGIRAIASAASGNFASAAAYTAAAAAAGIAAGRFHSEAVSMQQNRGYTAQERDSLTEQRSGAAGSGARAGAGGAGATTTERIIERVYYIGDPFLTPAENARLIARRMDLIDRLQLRSAGGSTIRDTGGIA